MLKLISIATMITLVSTGCGNSEGSKKGDSKRIPPKGDHPHDGTEDATDHDHPDAPADPANPANPANPTSIATALDIILVNAIGDENPDQAAQHRSALKGLMAGIGKKFTGKDFRLAVIGSPTAASSGVAMAIDAADGFNVKNSKQANFEITSKDAFLGALIAGCNVASSSLDSTHSAGSIKVCGDNVAIPAHAWTWGVEDLKGRFEGFLRPGSPRVYIFVGSRNIDIVSAKQFTDLATKQNKGKAPRIVAIAPVTTSAPCNQQNSRATSLEEAAKLTSSKVYSYCQTDWNGSIAEIIKDL